MITEYKTFATVLQQKDDHAQIEEAILKIPKVLEENQRLKEEIQSLKIWQSVLQNIQLTAPREFILQNKCQLLCFNGLEAVISIPTEGCGTQAQKKSSSIEAAFRMVVGQPVKVRFRFIANP
ncbi:hypothetical protein LC653_27735 [Nostoc sp. CHAB 5784]|uniref:hypothetical protein n=1 Tax=Nostoc mirabile TaxID=2907820 RepID=UPI001E56679B|nr:hypothetical protein [Nostoc mirabile]MCC5667570.1 hypothetical protein [Nostoc mirabile CHAB5784]